MAHHAGRFTDEVTARVKAWDSLPSLDRLLRVVEAARQADVEEATVSTLAKSRPRNGIPAPLRVVQLVLGGRLDTAMKEVSREGLLPDADKLNRATGASLAAEVLIPILLTAGVDATRCEGFPRIGDRRTLEPRRHAHRPSPCRLIVSSIGSSRTTMPESCLMTRITSWRSATSWPGTLDGMKIPPAKRLRYLGAGTALAAKAVAGIVGNKEGPAAVLAGGRAGRRPGRNDRHHEGPGGR